MASRFTGPAHSHEGACTLLCGSDRRSREWSTTIHRVLAPAGVAFGPYLLDPSAGRSLAAVGL